MEIINATPHEINVIMEGSLFTTGNLEKEISFPPSGIVVRLTTTKEVVGSAEGIPVHKVRYGEVEGLPEPQAEVVYIVSSLVANALKGKRYDLIMVDDTVRDEKGKIIGCKAFAIA